MPHFASENSFERFKMLISPRETKSGIFGKNINCFVIGNEDLMTYDEKKLN